MSFKAQFKSKSPYESWNAIGVYGTEAQAISAALLKKAKGAILVRVVDKKNRVVFSS
jgi:hypothetical protein